MRSQTIAQGALASLLWKNQKRRFRISKGKELESGGSDALADVASKIELQRIHIRSYHLESLFTGH